MPRDVPSNNVAEEDLPRLIREARVDGATRICLTPNGDGSWNIVVTFPN